MRHKFCILLILSVFSLASVYAGDLDRVGTVSGVQLLIPVGARSIAMGGASTADVKGAEAMFWNPAGLAYSPRAEVVFNNMQYIADIDLNYLAITYNGKSIGSFGFDIKNLSFGDIEETTEEFQDGTGDTYSPTFVVVGFSYARLLTDRIAAGVMAKFIHEGIMQTTASAFAFDLGVQYAFGKNLRLGVTMQNVGTKMQYDGRNMEESRPINGGSLIVDDGYYKGIALKSDIPSLFSFGLNYKVNVNEENNFMINGAFSNFNDASDQLFGGVEYGFKNLFFLRGGYNYEVQAGSDQIFGASFGAGLSYPVGGFNFALDYAWRQLTDYFDSNHIFTIKLAF